MKAIFLAAHSVAWLIVPTAAAYFTLIMLSFAAEGWSVSSWFVRNHAWFGTLFVLAGFLCGLPSAIRVVRRRPITLWDILTALPIFTATATFSLLYQAD